MQAGHRGPLGPRLSRDKADDADAMATTALAAKAGLDGVKPAAAHLNLAEDGGSDGDALNRRILMGAPKHLVSGRRGRRP